MYLVFFETNYMPIHFSKNIKNCFTISLTSSSGNFLNRREQLGFFYSLFIYFIHWLFLSAHHYFYTKNIIFLTCQFAVLSTARYNWSYKITQLTPYTADFSSFFTNIFYCILSCNLSFSVCLLEA